MIDLAGHQDLARARWFDPKISEQVEINAKYAVYLERQNADVAAFQRDDFCFCRKPSTIQMSPAYPMKHGKELATTCPRSVGQAGRIDGITPAALMLLAAYLRRAGRAKRQRTGG